MVSQIRYWSRIMGNTPEWRAPAAPGTRVHPVPNGAPISAPKPPGRKDVGAGTWSDLTVRNGERHMVPCTPVQMGIDHVALDRAGRTMATWMTRPWRISGLIRGSIAI